MVNGLSKINTNHKYNVNFSDFKRQLIHYTVLEPCEFG
jgi:hypothetical protein